MTLRKFLVIAFGLVLFAVFVVVQGAGCSPDCPDWYLESGDYQLNASHGDHQWLDEATLAIDREAGIALLRYTREGSTYEVTFTLDR